MSRLNKDREAELQPKRISFAVKCLENKGFEITYKDKTRIEFYYKGKLVRFWPYSGWHTGKTIVDGRGLNNLLNQLPSNAQL